MNYAMEFVNPYVKDTSCVLSCPGTISMEDIMLILPFGGTFDMILVKGSTLKKAFERSVHRYGSKKGEFLQIGGFRDTLPLRYTIVFIVSF